jgi:TIR domain-containing protein
MCERRRSKSFGRRFCLFPVNTISAGATTRPGFSGSVVKSHNWLRRRVRPDSSPGGGVFVSHSSKDVRFVRRLLKSLERKRVPCWFSEADISAGADWQDEIGRALKECDWYLIVLSPSAVRSVWVWRELKYALRQRRYNSRIIPVLFRNCRYERLSWTLPDIQYVDFRKDFGSGCKKLLNVLTHRQPKRASAGRS